LLSYPPFADLIRVVTSAEAPGEARAAADDVAAGSQAPGADVLGPAPLFRLRDRDRFQVVVKARDRPAAVRAVGAAVDRAAKAKEHRRVTFSVDVDPQ
jgi:primosomal protein N' (replication factor Y)